jgi:sodium/hydrogen exchanger-like protein 6/7
MFNYVKPVFITITTIAVIFMRYAAIFPLSEGINLFHKHIQGQRNEELPHSYQMMLFWAGLRGAVGVALAAGFKGSNAQMMRMTMLIVIVLTVIIFGSTSAWMLEVLGIRTGMEDDAGVSSDEDKPMQVPGWNVWVGGGGTGGGGGRWSRFSEDEMSVLGTGGAAQDAGRIGRHYVSRVYNHQFQDHGPTSPGVAAFSSASSDSYDSDGGEVLPLAPTAHNNTGAGSHPPCQNSVTVSMGIGKDGKWFQAIDERYLLPIFSNANMSWTFHGWHTQWMASGLAASNSHGSTMGTPADSEDKVDLSGQDVEMGQQGGGVNVRNIGSSNSGGVGVSSTQSISVDDSRVERSLPSLVLRNSAGDASRFS